MPYPVNEGPNYETALDFLRAVWKGEVDGNLDQRLEAAIAALPYTNPPLASCDITEAGLRAMIDDLRRNMSPPDGEED